MSDKITLNTPRKSQDIYFGTVKDYSKLISEYDVILVVLDKRNKDHAIVNENIDKIRTASASEVLIHSIEINNYLKNTDLLANLINSMGSAGLTRKSLVVALGGGATADLVGVAASIYMRGIDYGVIATSFIAMCDGIIGKVAVNNAQTKNLVGAFYSPRWIVSDVSKIDLTNKLVIAHGLVEVWKHAIIENNQDIKEQIHKLLTAEIASSECLKDICMWSMKTKAKYALCDWYDSSGFHKALSLGHTLANYLEMNESIHHSEAVLCGVLFESHIAQKRGLLSSTSADSIVQLAHLFEEVFSKFTVVLPLLNPSKIVNSLLKDKISSESELRLVLPTDEGYLVARVTRDEVEDATESLRQLIGEDAEAKTSSLYV